MGHNERTIRFELMKNEIRNDDSFFEKKRFLDYELSLFRRR